MKTLYFLRGLPASGKTTWAKKKLAALNLGGKRRAVRTNKDEIRARLSAKGISGESKVIRRETELVTKALQAGLDVIIDNTHFNPSTSGDIGISLKSTVTSSRSLASQMFRLKSAFEGIRNAAITSGKRSFGGWMTTRGPCAVVWWPL